MNADRHISREGLEALKAEEGLRLTAYQCSAEEWTIGYGTRHTALGPVREGMSITKAEAESLLESDVRMFERRLDDMLKVRASQAQWDAAVSLIYNIGIGAFSGSTLLRKWNAGDIWGAADEFLRWNKVRRNGELAVEPGLVKRRERERRMFLSQAAAESEEAVPAAVPSTPADAPPASKQEKPSMNPFILAALPSLLKWAGQAAPALIRMFGSDGSRVAERNAKAVEAVANAAMIATGQQTIEATVHRLESDPAAQQKYQAMLLDDLDRIMGIVQRGQEMDEASADRAAARSRSDTWDMLPFIANRGFHLLAGAIVIQVLLLALGFYLKVANEALMILLTLLVGTMSKLSDRWGQLYDYRIGSSSGSKASGDAVRALVEQRR